MNPTLVACVALVMAGAAPTPEPTGKPRLYMAWNAPADRPGATASLFVPCDGRNAADTLYLGFETGRDAETFYGMGARLVIHPAPGDTLGPLWSFGGGPKNPRNVWIEWIEPRHQGFRPAWRLVGQGIVGYDRQPREARLALSYSAIADSASAVRDSVRYDFARVIFPRGRADQPQCGQPISIEWQWADFSFSTDGETPEVDHPNPPVAVSWNDERGVARPVRNGPAPAGPDPKSKPKGPASR